MVESTRELIVFPTELALRRYQQEQTLERGCIDASGHTTFGRLRELCLPYLKLKDHPLSGAHEWLVRRQVVDTASGHFSDRGTLGHLAPAALTDVLDRLLAELSMLPGESARIVDWLLDHHKHHKLHELGLLFSVWRAITKQEGYVDRLDVNLALWRLLKGPREKWPPRLREVRQVTFRSVRWFNPFEEACVTALNQKLKLRVESALPPAHADESADRLGQRIRSEIMELPWAAWAENLGDALAVDSPDLLEQADTWRISFSRSAGAYGEIEDLARRICWNLETHATPANRIALVVPNISTVQDIIPHVFSRFRIPYYFRRGRPVLSSPCVKAFLAWLSFPLRPERDALIDLIRNPALQFEDREERVCELLKAPPRLDLKSISWVPNLVSCSGEQAAVLLAEWLVEPEDHFNSEALKAVEAALADIGQQSMKLADLIDLVEVLLESATVRPRDSHEQGVWILNPHDAVGLEFDLVLFAGLNEGEFPGVPQQDALLSDTERHWLRLHLEEQGRVLPKMALAESTVRYEQESVLFLSALGMAREQLVFSCQSVDQDGKEKSSGEYYRKLWNLAGWCVQNPLVLSDYDRWRIERLGENSVFADHWAAQAGIAPEDREPMPGESFLPVVPLPLCRAQDEALQAAVQQGRPAACDAVPPATGLLEHLVKMLKIEAEREAFLDAPVDERSPSKYCGQIAVLREHIAAWFDRKKEMSATALEALARNRYVFLLEKVFGLDEERAADDTPDPMERGSLVHSILKEIYTAIARDEAGLDVPRAWAVRSAEGWRKRNEGGTDALPLAVFVPEQADAYEGFSKGIAEKRLKQAGLGHPGVWAAEREKVLEQVLNFIRHDAAMCAAENRFPVLFEHRFGGEDAVNLGEVRLKGTIDRVDLCFAETGLLQKVRVLDYKGASRSRSRHEDYVEEISRNLDCQLPVYAFAAQQVFFGECNTAEANAMTEAGYLFYQREQKKIGFELKKCLIPMDEEGVLERFLATLHENIERLKAGDFAVDPLIKAYTDYTSVCRTEAVGLDELE